jgi:hypothetical protein
MGFQLGRERAQPAAPGGGPPPEEGGDEDEPPEPGGGDAGAMGVGAGLAPFGLRRTRRTASITATIARTAATIGQSSPAKALDCENDRCTVAVAVPLTLMEPELGEAVYPEAAGTWYV